jgi:hypothetical protein
VQLNGLASREVTVTVAKEWVVLGTASVRLCGETNLARLSGGQDPSRHLDAHHERITTLALRVNPDPLESFELSRDRVECVDAVVGVRIYDGGRDLKGVPAQLHKFGLVQFADRAVWIEERETFDQWPVEAQPERIIVGVAARGHEPATSETWAHAVDPRR